MDIWSEVMDEVSRARKKFPSPDLLTTAFAEEAGEVVKATLDHYAHKGCLTEVRKELIQTMAMCVRLMEEGDPVHRLPPTVSLDHRACHYRRRRDD